MVKRIELSPAELAYYDQSFSEGSQSLANLITAYEGMHAEDVADGIPGPVTVVTFASGLEQLWCQRRLASVLSVAVVLMADAGRHE